ncbi:MAG: phosphoglucosamine mutase [Methanobacteriaceae archaeon]|jgi:phosphoglucosamine mutase|nr:phosphoglucosamine mutase [Methanobacteriaceae archaeon]OPY19700.1 MAG: Phosphoglucosamine mutase [Methanobacterium sp. PtaU1.Bin097]
MDNKDEPPKLFGTSGIRGPIGTAVTADLALKMGRALSTLLGPGHDIVVGYDSRTSNQMLEKALIAGILEGGCDVLSLGMAPTPLVGYATMKLGDAGVMITASHNPPQDNGIKVWNKNGMAYRPNQERELEKIISDETFSNASWENIGKVKDIKNTSREYVKDLLDYAHIKPGLKVVVDCASGAASYLSPLILRKAGCEVVTLNSQPDGFFPGRLPEPSEANLQELMKMVKATQSDLGIAHDGDADRMIAVDEKGNMADFDKLVSLMAREVGGRVVTTVDASNSIDMCLEGKGEVIRTKVGDVHVAEAIEENDASFGGEPSGTWIHPDFCMCPDGILSALRIATLVSEKGPLSKLLDEVPSFPTLREKINCEEFQKKMIMEKTEAEFAKLFEDVSEVNLIDGVRLSLENGSWVLIRPSGTESYVRITLGGKTDLEAQKLMDKSKAFMKNLL